MNRLLGRVFLICIASIGANATQITALPVEELVARADYVVIGKIEKVDMVDGSGNIVSDPAARTGPTLPNRLRLHVRISRRGVLKGNAKDLPKMVILPEWRRWWRTLKDRKAWGEKRSLIFFLKGKEFTPVTEPQFFEELSERDAVEKAVKGAPELGAGADARR